jgi:uncharacterized protein YpuA (DUF1002 family)
MIMGTSNSKTQDEEQKEIRRKTDEIVALLKLDPTKISYTCNTNFEDHKSECNINVADKVVRLRISQYNYSLEIILENDEVKKLFTNISLGNKCVSVYDYGLSTFLVYVELHEIADIKPALDIIEKTFC